MKVSVVGAGKFGKNHVRTLSAMGVLSSIVDLNPGVREAAVRDFPGIEAFESVEEMLATDVDAVVVATPAHAHFEVAKHCLQAGKDCLVEKPITLNSADAEHLVKLAAEGGRVLMVGHLLLYQPAIEAAKAAIERGDIGTVLSIHQERLNLGTARAVENALWSLGVHDVAVALFLAGSQPTNATVSGKCGLQPHIEDDTYTHIMFANGIQAHLHASWLWPELRRRLTVVGTHGFLVFDETAKTIVDGQSKPNPTLELHRKRINENLENEVGETTVIYQGASEPLRLELQHFVDCVSKRNTPRSDGVSAVHVLRAIELAQENQLS